MTLGNMYVNSFIVLSFHPFQKRRTIYFRVLSQLTALTCIIVLQVSSATGLVPPRSYSIHDKLSNNNINVDAYRKHILNYSQKDKSNLAEYIPLFLRNILKRTVRDTREDRLCRMVCRPCDKILSKSYSALCWNHCHRGGRAFDACVTMLTLIDQLDEDELEMYVL